MDEKILIYEKRFLHGIPNPMWIRNVELIGNFIDKNKLVPMADHNLMPVKRMEKAGLAANQLSLHYVPWWWFGGIKVAHLHFNGEVYILNDAQWKNFSKDLMHGMKTRIDNAGTIPFESSLEMAQIVESFH